MNNDKLRLATFHRNLKDIIESYKFEINNSYTRKMVVEKVGSLLSRESKNAVIIVDKSTPEDIDKGTLIMRVRPLFVNAEMSIDEYISEYF